MRAAIAQYYPADSVLHRLDPRAKTIAVTALAVALFTRDSFAALAVYGAVALVALVVSRVPPVWFWKLPSVRLMLPPLWLLVTPWLTYWPLLSVSVPPLVIVPPFSLYSPCTVAAMGA